MMVNTKLRRKLRINRVYGTLSLILFSVTVLLFSCTSSQEEVQTPPSSKKEEEKVAQEEKQKEPEKEESKKGTKDKEPEESAEEEPQSENYTLNEEEYKKTKKDLSELVSKLNEIIAAGNYSKWLTYLTDDYKEYYSDPEVLKEYSQSDKLKKYNITLRSLKDYFNYVVVQSRKNIQVDDIKAVSENKVKAYMYINDDPFIVYTLEKVDGEWKITK